MSPQENYTCSQVKKTRYFTRKNSLKREAKQVAKTLKKCPNFQHESQIATEKNLPLFWKKKSEFISKEFSSDLKSLINQDDEWEINFPTLFLLQNLLIGWAKIPICCCCGSVLQKSVQFFPQQPCCLGSLSQFHVRFICLLSHKRELLA